MYFCTCHISLYNSTPTLILPLPKTPGIPQTPFMCRVMYRCFSCSSHPRTRYCITSCNDPKILGRTSTPWCLIFLLVRRRMSPYKMASPIITQPGLLRTAWKDSMVCSLVTCPLMASFTSHHATANKWKNFKYAALISQDRCWALSSLSAYIHISYK
jgi:hypothetical protein